MRTDPDARSKAQKLRKVSHRSLQGCLNEFTWRYNHRHESEAMFETLLLKAAN